MLQCNMQGCVCVFRCLCPRFLTCELNSDRASDAKSNTPIKSERCRAGMVESLIVLCVLCSHVFAEPGVLAVALHRLGATICVVRS